MSKKEIRRHVSLWDIHWGYERKQGRLSPVHNSDALSIAFQFIQDFNPHDIIFGGDGPDCACISHWNDRTPRKVEGMRLDKDIEEFRRNVLTPLEARKATRTYLLGNHEDWLDQLADRYPALSGYLAPESCLGLAKWKVIPQGGKFHLGKLVFKHGDTVGGGEHTAKKAVCDAEKSIRIGHSHTFNTFTKTSDVDLKQKHTGISMPCLCNRGPTYAKSRANKWINGFGFGYTLPDGSFTDYVVVIVNKRAVIQGKLYRP